MDNLTKEQRSKCMSNIRSKWTSGELLIHNYLKGNKVKHKMHPHIEGNPDIIFSEKNIALYIHGCFWHKCPICFKEPKSNIEYWLPKIDKNVKRDASNIRSLKKRGIKTVVLWEHELKKSNKVETLKKLIKMSI